MKLKGWILEAAILAAGVIVMGLCLKTGIDNYVNKDRKVTVKGLSERQVKANHVTWPITLKETGDDLQELHMVMSSKKATVLHFLGTNNVNAADIAVAPPTVSDQNTNNYSGNEKSGRYTITQVIIVSSKQVDLVRSIINRQGELMGQGVALINASSYEDTGGGVTYEFTTFMKMKPTMMHEAISNARSTAVQFAKQCGSELGKIETANQGEFSIDDRDSNTPWIKTLRVVTTVTYALKD